VESVKIPLDRILQKMADHAEKMQDGSIRPRRPAGLLDTEIATTHVKSCRNGQAETQTLAPGHLKTPLR
jgi:hypothetical protein